MSGDLADADGAVEPGRIVLVCGPPGAGKSTLARRLAEGFERSAHLKVDDLREIMVNGFDPPSAVDPACWQFALFHPTARHVLAVAVHQEPGQVASISLKS